MKFPKQIKIKNKNFMLHYKCDLNEGVEDMKEVTSLTNMRGSWREPSPTPWFLIRVSQPAIVVQSHIDSLYN